MPTYRKPEEYSNKLQRLLLTAVPENKFGNKTILHLASLLKVSPWAIRKWIINKKISPQRAMDVVKIGEIGVPKGEPGRVKLVDFDPFVYKV